MTLSGLQHVLCILILLCFVKTSHHVLTNVTLLFDSAEHGDRLCNCSCATAMRSCDQAFANLMCSCGTVWRSALSAGTIEAESLTVWAWQQWLLIDLLNGSRVSELHLSLCSPASSLGPSRYLTIVGLRKLQIWNEGGPKQKSEQVLNFGLDLQDRKVSVAFLDMWTLSNHLKAYSIVGPPLEMLIQHFPDIQQANIKITDLEEIYKLSVLTFIY